MTQVRQHAIAGWLFLLDGIYGLAALLMLGISVGGHTHGEAQLFLCGFIRAAGATEILYLMIAADVARYRPLMLVGVVSKSSFFLPCVVLCLRGAIGGATFMFGGIDAALGAAFFASWWLLGDRSPADR